MRTAGFALLWIGVLAASFISVRVASPDAIQWGWYGATAAVALIGVVLMRLSASRDPGQGQKIKSDIGVMRTSLAAMRESMAGLLEGREGIDVYDVKDRIDGELAPELARFADAREAMIPAFGLDGYAEVMTRFAGAERMINRAWSASADGYIDEVWKCVEHAAFLLAEAADRFASMSA